MKRDIAERWAAALESGDYKQGIGQLTSVTPDGDRDCCLGVLCKLAIEDGVPISSSSQSPPSHEDDGVIYGVIYDESATLLPHMVMQWAGMKTSNGAYTVVPHGNNSLTREQ
jgi:hypothetical protein